MRHRFLFTVEGFLALLACAASLSAQRPVITPQQLNENCVVSVLNRNVRANPDGTWVLPNVPANFGPVRARATCVIDGKTVSGESDPFEVPANGAVNIPEIRLGPTTPIPVALTLMAQATTLTEIGQTGLLSVTARYPDGSTREVTAGAGTTYGVTNAAIATVSSTGVLEARASGTVIVQATLEGASGMLAIRVALTGTDTDADGIPDTEEVRLGLNANNPIDALEDFDRDSLTNKQEWELGTDLRNADTDRDGLKDSDELSRKTDALLPDTDGDGIRDGLEVSCASDPLDPTRYNLSCALSSLTVTPASFNLTYNTVEGSASARLKATGALKDGTTLDLTSTSRGTNYLSSAPTVCTFGLVSGEVFAGESGECTITVSIGGFEAVTTGVITTFAPRLLSSLEMGSPGNGVDVSGDFAFVASGPSGLKVVDVSDRSAPKEIVSARLPLHGISNDVKLSGDYAFVASGEAGLHIVDVTNPVAPRLLGSVDTPGVAIDVRIRANLAFVADSTAGLQVVDVSDPRTPRIVGVEATAPGAYGVDIDGSLAVVATRTEGLRIVSVANPAKPEIVGSVATPGGALDVVVQNGFAYVADNTGTLRTVDYRNPRLPRLGGTIPEDLSGFLRDVALTDRFAFGASGNRVIIPIVDVSDVDNLRPRGLFNLRLFDGGATGQGIAADGSYVYLGTDQGRFYIGQFRIQQDFGGVAPSVVISSPSADATFVEGETFSVSVAATDDVAVTAVTLLVDGAPLRTDTTTPYQFSVTVPSGAPTIQLSAEATDLGGNVGRATDVVVTIIPDPLTTVTGRVVLPDGTPVSGAEVRCGGLTDLTTVDGLFEVMGVRTAKPTVACSASLVVGSLTQRGVSPHLRLVRGGVTQIGDLGLGPIPAVSSVMPRVLDVIAPLRTLHVTGVNFNGATFSVTPVLTPSLISLGPPLISEDGRSASMPITVDPTARGRFNVVASNTFGGDATPTTANRLTVVSSQNEVDQDGDGFPEGLELLFGSDPGNALSTPSLQSQGVLAGAASSTVNTLLSLAVPRNIESEADRDGDGFPEGLELVHGSNPFITASVPDLTARGQLNSHGASVVNTLLSLAVPRNIESEADRDGDGFPEGLELVHGSNPFIAASVPELTSRGAAQALAVSVWAANPPVLSAQQPGRLTLQTQAIDVAAQSNERPSAARDPSIALTLTEVPESLVEGQTIRLRVAAQRRMGSGVSFTVNGELVATDPEAPYELVFTVPSGVDAVTFGATGNDRQGRSVLAASRRVPVERDPLTTITGRVTDSEGNPLQGAVVDLLASGLRVEFFAFGRLLSSVPDLTGMVAARTSWATAVNVRNPNGVFGVDPFGTGLVPDYASRFTGWLLVTRAGHHTFFLGAHAGARLRINDVTVIDIADGKGVFQEGMGSIELRRGLVPIEITHYEDVGNAELQLSYAPPRGAREVVPPSVLIPDRAPFVTRTDASGMFRLSGVPTALAGIRVRATVVVNGRSMSAQSAPVAPLLRTRIEVGDVTIRQR